MRKWKLMGLLALTLAVFAAACGGGSAPKEGTPAGTPTGPAPTGATPTGVAPFVAPSPVPCVSVAPVASTSTIPLGQLLPVGKIAFASFRDEYQGRPNREIYLISADGSGPTNLTLNSCADDEPDLSRDGSKIAWESDRDGDFEIYVMNADGSGVTQLTTEGGAVSARWSPDGRRIAYSRGGAIKVMNADGGDPKVVLAGGPESAAPDLCHTGGFPGGWSPDGTRVIYYAASLARQVGNVCTVSVDGLEVKTVVSQPPVYNVEPVWSPDGKRIAFRSIRDGNHDIYVVDADGGSEQRLTDVSALDTEPAWSPDGQWIAFASNRDTGVATDIYIMRADGSDVRRLTDDPAKDSYPVWSP